MNKRKKFLVLAIISLMMLAGSTAGCAAVAPTGPAAKPTINSFTVSPASIDSSQRTTLSWDVSGAATATIQPEIGSVGPSGSLQLSPPATITYTLTATNEAGSATGSVTLSVTPVVAGKPDLVITDMWLLADTIYYKIKNQGDAAAIPTWSTLYVYDLKETTGYVDSLAAGEERTESFSNWAWPYPPPPGPGFGAAAPEPFAVKVCADAENDIEESNKDNNCITAVWGQPLTYDFTQQAHLAKWRSSACDSWQSNACDLRWGGLPNNKNGAAFILTGDLFMCPEKVSNGWILGRFADHYSELGMSLSQEIVVPANVKFIADLGFRKGVTSSDGVRVALGYLDETFSLVLFPKMDVYSDGELHTYEVDLSALEDKRTEFFLWVEAKNSPDGDCVRWVNPRIIQK
jgi:PKD repeat protein